ncbi:hypothetical protein ASF22_05030 [Methylobacterium sp. Leaf87]|uniref:hypothetical protein n=1 Tax=Methylobacterium sp. Leaf87 TaxID=1736243 RepID=UPI0006F762D6|nr:hypothetical protein [Methylobacterium sp. Leaf87]KQO66034.1 hypothetical protein ASF22_05030 [Methylobacterium sp. Leaf87]
MNQPKLQRHPNGKFYIHWVKGRRSLRVTTGQDNMRGALLVYADWVFASIDALFPPKGSERGLQHDDTGRLSSRPLTLSRMSEAQVAKAFECTVPQLRKLRAALLLDVEETHIGG